MPNDAQGKEIKVGDRVAVISLRQERRSRKRGHIHAPRGEVTEIGPREGTIKVKIGDRKPKAFEAKDVVVMS